MGIRLHIVLQRLICVFLLLCLSSVVFGQSFSLKGTVLDHEGEAVQFAHLSLNQDSTRSYFTDISGRFMIKWQHMADSVTIDHIDFSPQRTTIRSLIHDTLRVVLSPKMREDSSYDVSQMTIGLGTIERVVANKRLHDPEKQGGSFRYTTYTKSSIDLIQNKNHRLSEYFKPLVIADSAYQLHHRVSGSQHVAVIESMTDRFFKYPNKDHERILGVRETGEHNSQLMSLNSNQHPLSFYDNYYTFLGTRYASPVGVETYEKYQFSEEARYYAGQDTIFVIAFKPIKLRTTGLEGLLHVNSRQYAIQHIIARPVQNELVKFQISQKSIFLDSTEWFPSQMNHLIYVDKYPKKYLSTVYDKQTYLQNIELNPKEEVHKGLEVVLMDHFATDQAEEFWDSHRVDPLSKKEKMTYLRVDSLEEKDLKHQIIERTKGFVKSDLNYRLGHFSFNNLFGVNRYEGVRLGLGGTFGRDLMKVMEFNGYGAYGVRDADWKWGVGGGIFLNEKKEMEIKGSHKSDLEEPGRVSYLGRDQDLFRTLVTDRMDRVSFNQVAFNFRTPKYHLFELALKTERTDPLYDYRYVPFDTSPSVASEHFQVTEFQFRTRYAINEKISNMFGYTTRLSSFSPVIYLSYHRGFDGWLGGQFEYDKVFALVDYQFHIGHLGLTSLSLDAGIVNGDVPYAYLFNAKGSNLGVGSVIVEDHFQTMGLYEYASDRYFNVFFSHDFGTKLFANAWFRPDIVIYQNVGWGQLSQPEEHQVNGSFVGSYAKGYFESGLGFNNLLKFNLFGKLYGGLGVGFFYRYGAYANEGGLKDNLVLRATYVIRSL